MTIDVTEIGTFADRAVRAFTLRNGNGISATVVEHGARIVSVSVPNLSNTKADVVPAAADLAGYAGAFASFGAICGRFANRIDAGRLHLDGTTHQLALSEGAAHHLHGGPQGFHRRLWQGETEAESVTFRLSSVDGD
jgi:aldose 1-epimerase